MLAERRLRDAILGGDVAPGQRLVEAELGERYGVTRSSARLALDALMADGLVERIPNRGAVVRSIAVAEAVAIMECRMVLDGLLAAKAAQSATDAERAALQDNLQRMQRAVADAELLVYSELIQRHHAIVRDAARQPIAVALVERLHAQVVRQQFQLSLQPGRARQSLGELESVVGAIAAGDAEHAEQAARDHIGGTIAALRAHDP